MKNCCYGLCVLLCVVLVPQTAFAGDPVGACCRDDGICVVVPEDECQGHYEGDGTVCDPNPCSPGPIDGACCFDDGSCLITLKKECEGAFQGTDTVCDPNPCPQGGACCFEDAPCIVISRAKCGDNGGAYQGDNVECEPDTCQSTPTHQETWGRIKELYR